MGICGGKEEPAGREPPPTTAPATGGAAAPPAATSKPSGPIGDLGVGKTSLYLRLCANTYVEEDPTHTRPPPNLEHFPDSQVITVDGKVIRLKLVDTNGTEKFRTVSDSLYRGVDGLMLVFALDQADSLAHVQSTWVRESDKYSAPHCQKLLVGNKSDLAAARQVEAAKAQNFANQHEMGFFETSAKTGSNVQEAFARLARDMKKEKARLAGQGSL